LEWETIFTASPRSRHASLKELDETEAATEGISHKRKLAPLVRGDKIESAVEKAVSAGAQLEQPIGPLPNIRGGIIHGEEPRSSDSHCLLDYFPFRHKSYACPRALL